MKSKLTNLLLVLLLCIIPCNSVHSETILPDISNMSVEELLSLRDNIDVLLEEKGYKVYFDIERGTKSEEVSLIQEQLTSLGFYTGKITGKFDSETQKAFKLFEKTNGLTNDGLASREDQLVLFGDGVIAKIVSSSESSLDKDIPEKRNVEIEHDTSFDYEQCMRFPDDYVGEKYKLKGKVEQTLGNRTNGFELRFSILGNSDEIIYVYVNDDPGYNILEGDWLIIDLEMRGTITYESIWGQEITIPAASATELVLK